MLKSLLAVSLLASSVSATASLNLTAYCNDLGGAIVHMQSDTVENTVQMEIVMPNGKYAVYNNTGYAQTTKDFVFLSSYTKLNKKGVPSATIGLKMYNASAKTVEITLFEGAELKYVDTCLVTHAETY